MKKIAIFASGSGSNFKAIVDSINQGKIQAEISLLVCDKSNAKVVTRAKQENIPTFVFAAKDFKSKADYEKLILEKLVEQQVEFIVLAGYMRLIGGTLLHAFEGKIINIHPSLLPHFPGLDAVGQALAARVKETGVTVHFVDEGMDTGPIIAQRRIGILPNDTKESLEIRIHTIEHALYPETLATLLNPKGVGIE